MPELPEAETVKRALEKHLPGCCFTRIETFVPALRFTLDPLHDPVLLSRKIIAVRRRARYLVVEMTDNRALIFHLGMTGTVRIAAPDVPRLKHEHVIFYLDNGLTFRFEDPRRFGFILPCILPQAGADPVELAGLGPEPLSNDFTPEYLFKALQGKKMKLKTALMDNAIVVGVGNIYANESLFLSGLNPACAAGTVSLAQCRVLVGHICATLRRAIEAGGTTVSDFKGVDGEEGRFVLQLNVYGKNGAPCPRCGATIERVVIGGRGSFYCPACQPANN